MSFICWYIQFLIIKLLTSALKIFSYLWFLNQERNGSAENSCDNIGFGHDNCWDSSTCQWKRGMLFEVLDEFAVFLYFQSNFLKFCFFPWGGGGSWDPWDPLPGYVPVTLYYSTRFCLSNAISLFSMMSHCHVGALQNNSEICDMCHGSHLSSCRYWHQTYYQMLRTCSPFDMQTKIIA
jgi:hypothetical protein